MIKNQTIKERLLLFINAKEIRKSHFEKACGLSNGYINSIINTISVEKLEDILKAYPELNRVWLLTGEGEMINNGDKSVIGDNNNNISHVIQSNITTNSVASIDKLVELLTQAHQDIKKKDEQIDRLLSLLEKAQQ